MARGKDKTSFHRPFASLADWKPAALGGSTRAPREPAALPPSPETGAPSASEEDLFLAEVAGATPLGPAPWRVGAPPAPPRSSPHRHAGSDRRLVGDDAEVLAELADLVTGQGGFDVRETGETVEGLAEGVDRRLLKRLRAGEYAVQAHLDLHGLTRDAARERVARFVAESRRAQHRCVLIVHGRGLHSAEEVPVLKHAVVTWLERGSVARSVLAFSTARPRDGGAGAIYVLLRR